jgi:hypothetical protein
MKSPFPGMDPYLEQYWHDVHHALITYARDQIQTRLPADLRARVQQRVFVETAEESYRAVYPDVHVVEYSHRSVEGSSAAQAVPGTELAALEEPLILHLDDEPIRQGYIEIVEAASGHRVITTIEFLSPSNKLGGIGQELYLRKQQEVLAAGISLVEIDLTRTGRRILSVLPDRIPPSHRTLYQAVVRRGWRRQEAEIYRMPLDRPLPKIRIPLRPTDSDVLLDLQEIVDMCYLNGKYTDIDYRTDPIPPLTGEEARWADQLLRSKGLR